MSTSSTLSEPVTQSWLAVTEYRKRQIKKQHSVTEIRKNRTFERSFTFISSENKLFQAPEKTEGQRRGGTQTVLMFSVCTLLPLEHCD